MSNKSTMPIKPLNGSTTITDTTIPNIRENKRPSLKRILICTTCYCDSLLSYLNSNLKIEKEELEFVKESLAKEAQVQTQDQQCTQAYTEQDIIDITTEITKIEALIKDTMHIKTRLFSGGHLRGCDKRPSENGL